MRKEKFTKKLALQSKNKRIIHPLVITLNLLVILLLGNAVGIGQISMGLDSPAGSSSTAIPAVSGTADLVNTVTANQCVIKLTEFGDPEFEKYKTFMTDNFKNKSTTSSLMDLGLKRYDNFKAAIRNQYELLLGKQLAYAADSGAGVGAQINGLNACEAKALEYIDNASKFLKMRAIDTSGLKKASIFVEKYQQLNSKLRIMDVDVMKMVVNLSTFEQKLPCYLKTCT